MAKSPFDKIRSALDAERVGPAFAEMLREIDLDALRQTVEALSEVVDTIESLADGVEAIADADGSEERADAREEALGLLDEAVTAINNLPGPDDTLLILALTEVE